MSSLVKASLVLVIATVASAQSPHLEFEVASVKSSIPGTTGGGIKFLPGGRFNAVNVPLSYLIQQLYKVRQFQIVGDAASMSIIADGYRSRYDIEAKGDPSAQRADLREMVMALLEEKFQLKVHRETRERAVYALIAAKGGSKLLRARDTGRNPGGGGVAFMVSGWIEGKNVSTSTLSEVFTDLVDRPVVDRTNITDPFDFELTFTPEDERDEPRALSEGGCPIGFSAYRESRGLAPKADSCPSIFTAVQEQLGLKLDPQRVPVEVLVIDHVDHLSAN